MPRHTERGNDQQPIRRSFETSEQGRQQLAGRVAALREPSAYPGNVREVETIETHMAWVFLTDRHAFKLKKPIRTEYLDYRTIEARRRACRTECDLNRRLAEPVYLDVVPVADRGDRLVVGGEGRPVDWLVQMRRLSRQKMLDSRIGRAAVEASSIDRLGDKLVEFYRSVEREPFGGPAYRERMVSDIQQKGESLEQPHYGLDSQLVETVVESQKEWIEDHISLVRERGSSVVEAHGDLRPEHVYLNDEPMVIDCLEFDRDLRLLDPVSELAFVGLECRRLGSSWIGDRLLDVYGGRTGDEVTDELVRFYQSYHAVVRAAIAVWHLDDTRLDNPDKWRDRGRTYLDMALHLVESL